MADKQVLHELKSGLVLDRSLFKTYSADAMASVITSISNKKMGLMVVEDADMFFTPDNLITMIVNKDGRYRLVNEKINFFTEEQIKALMDGAKAPQAPQEVADDGLVVKVGGGANNYPFAPVPEGWSMGANMSLGPTKIKRKKVTPQGDSKDFYLSPDAYRDLWRAASEFWAPVPGYKTCIKLKTENGDRTFNFNPHYVASGFIRIYRHELEQVAKYRGWEFPVAAKLAA